MVPSRALRGVTLVDTVIGVFLVVIVFLALVGLMRASLLVSSLAKAKAGATAVANTQMEYIRSLPYDSVGTVGGIPAGAIPQYATTTANAIPYGIRTFIEYVDDPADGTGASDTNGITTDYKRIKVAVTYTLKGRLREVDMVSNYAPASIETSTGGGTLKVVVVSSAGAPVSGASVRVVNASTSPAVDVTTFTDATGVVLLGGAATSTQYQIYVSKNGYSSAQTYARDTNNQNPTPGYLTVVKNTTTTATFAIDLLSTLTLRTFYPVMATSTTDTLVDASKLGTLTNTQLTSGTLTLAGDSGSGYAASGNGKTMLVAPARLVSWLSASTTIVTSGSTQLRAHVVDSTGALLPDSVLSGNSTGFTGSSINLSGVSTTTYPSLGLSFDLSTSDASSTPALDLWAISSLVGPTPVPNVSVTLTGAKTIGSTGAGAPIYKASVATTTGAQGANTLSLEWDSYSLTLTGYDVIDACSAPPFSLTAGSSQDQSLYLAASTGNSLLVTVRDSAGNIVPGATVTLTKTGYSGSGTTSACGTAYFSGLAAASSYTVQIQKTGYTTTSAANVNVSGHSFYTTSFP